MVRAPAPGASENAEATTRQKLVEAAIRAFAAGNYEGVSLREIERQAGVNRNLAAYHFGGKEELWKASVEWIMEKFEGEMARYGEVLLDVSPPERTRIALRALGRFMAKYPEFFRLLLQYGSDESDRGRWVFERLKLSSDFLLEATGTAHLSQEQQAIAFIMFAGAVSLVFVTPAISAVLFDTDPTTPAFQEHFIDAAVALFHSSDFFAGLQPRRS